MLWKDRHGRVHDVLRISVTDRCNLRCAYCLPEEPEWFPRNEILRYEEIERLAGILSRGGVRRVRITGAEPLVRKDLPLLVNKLTRVPGIEEVSLTTNGVLLAGAAADLAAAGLRRVNVSLDTLIPERFIELTRRDALQRVLEGLDAARSAGLDPVRINTVLLRGVNDDEVESFIDTARSNGWEVRFIEFMPLENGGTWDRDRVVSGEEVKKRIEALWPIDPHPGAASGAPAARYVFRDGGGVVGFINSVTEPFCAGCTRLRITADGQLKVCLHERAEVDLKGPLREGANDEALERIIRQALLEKGVGGSLELFGTSKVPVFTRTMHQIGG